MNTSHPTQTGDETTPWQLWVVIALLAAEGIGNLLSIAVTPVAAIWLAAKVLFIIGLIRRWRVVFILFVVITAMHVLGFASSAPIVAFLNLFILVVAVSQFRRFFPRDSHAGFVESSGQA